MHHEIQFYYIDQHDFLVKQFNDRVLSQFTMDNIEKAHDEDNITRHKKIIQSTLPVAYKSRYMDTADRESVEFALNLVEMRKQLILSGLVFLYSNWEKTLRAFLESIFTINDAEKHYLRELWDPSIFKIFEKISWNVRKKEFYPDLNLLRTVTNVFKHGKGESLLRLKKLKPEYFLSDEELEMDEEYLYLYELKFRDHTDINITQNEFVILSNAIRQFWVDFPERLILKI